MRWAGLLLVVAAGFLAGTAAGESLRGRTAFLGQVEQLLSYLAQEAAYSGDTFGEILSRAPNAESVLGSGAVNPYSNIPLQLTNAVREGLCKQYLTKEERGALEALWRALGTGARPSEVERLRLAGARFAGWKQAAESDAESKGGLYRTLGVYGGLAAAILLA